jgi:hypothetical protein
MSHSRRIRRSSGPAEAPGATKLVVPINALQAPIASDDRAGSQPNRAAAAAQVFESLRPKRQLQLVDPVGIVAGNLAQQHQGTDEEANELDLRHDQLSRSFVCAAGFAE